MSAPSPVCLDPAAEQEARAFLVQHFAPAYGERVAAYVQTLLAVDHYADRFLYLRSVVGPEVLAPQSSILVSGYGAGSELLVARQFGFGPVVGVEVDEVWRQVSLIRLRGVPEMSPDYYDGGILPYGECRFQVVVSGHVVEHTPSPALYLSECLRVLAPGGYLSLEFPHRYHWQELHTGLVSFEWLPLPVRTGVLRALSGRRSPLKGAIKDRYRSIFETGLLPVSLGGVRRWLARSGYRFTLMDARIAAPGIVRCVFRRDG